MMTKDTMLTLMCVYLSFIDSHIIARFMRRLKRRCGARWKSTRGHAAWCCTAATPPKWSSRCAAAASGFEWAPLRKRASAACFNWWPRKSRCACQKCWRAAWPRWAFPEKKRLHAPRCQIALYFFFQSIFFIVCVALSCGALFILTFAHTCPPIFHPIIQASGRNLRRALLMLEATKVQAYPFTEQQPLQMPDWEVYIQALAKEITQEQSPQKLLKAREMLYELLTNCIPADVVRGNKKWKLLQASIRWCAQWITSSCFWLHDILLIFSWRLATLFFFRMGLLVPDHEGTGARTLPQFGWRSEARGKKKAAIILEDNWKKGGDFAITRRCTIGFLPTYHVCLRISFSFRSCRWRRSSKTEWCKAARRSFTSKLSSLNSWPFTSSISSIFSPEKD